MSIVLDGTNGITTNSGTVVSTTDATIHGLTVGLGGGSVSTSTLVGNGSLTATAGAGSSVFGYQSAVSSTGNYVDAFGYQALNANTSGTGNVGIGSISLSANTTGGSNTALGRASLSSNTTGSYNVGLGFQALQANTTASNHTAVGYQAGYSATGGGTTFLGNAAGSNLTTGSNGIYIGNSCSAGSVSATFEIVIGAAATGKGTNTGFINPNTGGVYQGNNSSTWSTTSDARIKENVVALDDALSKILALRPVSFDYIVSKRADVSFIAQEYQTVFPEQVNTHSASPEEKEVAGTDTLFGLNKNLDPYLVRAIQQLNALVTAQATEIQALKAKVGI